MDQDLQSRVEELEQNLQAKDREAQQELRQKVYIHVYINTYTLLNCSDNIVHVFSLQEEQLLSFQRDLAQAQQQIRLKVASSPCFPLCELICCV